MLTMLKPFARQWPASLLTFSPGAGPLRRTLLPLLPRPPQSARRLRDSAAVGRSHPPQTPPPLAPRQASLLRAAPCRPGPQAEPICPYPSRLLPTAALLAPPLSVVVLAMPMMAPLIRDGRPAVIHMAVRRRSPSAGRRNTATSPPPLLERRQSLTSSSRRSSSRSGPVPATTQTPPPQTQPAPRPVHQSASHLACMAEPIV